MSTLKQEILEQVKKGENVLQSSDAGAGSPNLNEGNIYECRFHAPVYDPDTGDGVLCDTGELRKYTRLDVNGDTQTYVIEKQGTAQSLGFKDTVSGKIGIVGAELHVPQLLRDLTTNGSFVPESSLLQNGGKYFTRKFVAEDAGGSAVTLEDVQSPTINKVVIEDAEVLEENWATIRDRLFIESAPGAVTAGNKTATAEQGQIVYWANNPTVGKSQARTLNQKFFGKITNGDTVPADSIFYYDGADAIFTVDTPGGGGGTSKENKLSAKGFYIAVGADFVVDDHADVSAGAGTVATAVVADQTTLDNAAAGTIVTYVYGGRPVTGGNTNQVRFYDAMGFQDVEDLSFDRFSTEASQVPGLYAAITDPVANTNYWKLEVAVTTPVDENGVHVDAAVFEKTSADSLDERAYWNLVSQGFVEDHDIPVGTAGLVGADDGGVYSTREANGAPKANYGGQNFTQGSQSERVNEIVSTAGSTGDEEVKVTTLFNHGLEVGDQVVITNTGVTEIDSAGGSHEVSAIGGASGTDTKTFSLKDISKAVLAQGNPGQADIAASVSLGEVTTNGIPHLFWGLHTPPTTDQALLYRY